MAKRPPKLTPTGLFLMIPQFLDQWRVWPRMFIVFYFWLAMQTASWFMDLPDPTNAQAGFAGAVVSAGAAWFGLYVNSGPRPLDTTPINYYSNLPPPGENQPSRKSDSKRRPEDNSEGEEDTEPKG